VQKGVKCTPPKTFRQGPQKLFVVAPLCPLFVVATLPFAAKGQTGKEKIRVRGSLFSARIRSAGLPALQEPEFSGK
jgi:hypothetical protein